MENKKSLVARFYSEPEQEGAREPVKEWLRQLPQGERAEVGADIRIVQDYWPHVREVRPKLVEYIRDDVWEIRTTLKDHWHRVFFGFVNGELLLLHAIKKKTNQTRDNDISTAIGRLKKALAACDKK